MSNSVFVLNDDKTPLMPCKPARARLLLKQGRAAVFRKQPFTIIMKEQIENPVLENIEVKIDPGSKTTGIALVMNTKRGARCIWGANLKHRGQQIRDALLSRAQTRRGRRSRKLRYRKPRFLNRVKSKGWLAPSIYTRVDNTLTWVNRLMRYSPVTSAVVELVKFDMQKMENPEIAGKAYQRGSLFNYEVKEYLLYRYNHTCQYCSGASKDPILEIEHIVPRASGGSNRLSNLTLSCATCNREKGKLSLADWKDKCTHRKNPIDMKRLKGIVRVGQNIKPALKDAAAVNATRYRLVAELDYLGLHTETSGGHITKYNRKQQGYPKDHWIDAALVGERGSHVHIPPELHPLIIKKVKVNNRQMTKPDKYGFPRTKAKGPSRAFGFKTGDIAASPFGVGRVVIRTSGTFNVLGRDVSWKRLVHLSFTDGYEYVDQRIVKMIVDKHTVIKEVFERVISKTLIDADSLLIEGTLNRKVVHGIRRDSKTRDHTKLY